MIRFSEKEVVTEAKNVMQVNWADLNNFVAKVAKENGYSPKQKIDFGQELDLERILSKAGIFTMIPKKLSSYVGVSLVNALIQIYIADQGY